MTTTAKRPTGTEALSARFPNAFPLWQLSGSNKNGFVNEFRLSAWNVNGRLVLLQEFDEERGNSWDVFVAASDSGEIGVTLDAVARAVGL